MASPIWRRPAAPIPPAWRRRSRASPTWCGPRPRRRSAGSQRGPGVKARGATPVTIGHRDAPTPIDRRSGPALPFTVEEEAGTARSERSGRRGSRIIDLGRARDARRVGDYRARLGTVLETNRKALGRLFQTGLIFSRAGARLGRDLLLAHQHLLRVGDLLARLDELSAEREGASEAQALYREVQRLLVRTTALTARSDGILARR